MLLQGGVARLLAQLLQFWGLGLSRALMGKLGCLLTHHLRVGLLLLTTLLHCCARE